MALRVTVLDESTGELVVTAPAWNRPRQPRWIKVFADSYHNAMIDPTLRHIDIRVLGYLITRMDRDNLLWSRPRYIAEDIRCSQSAVSHALQRLDAAGYIERPAIGAIRVKHKVAWRASTLRWAEVQQQS